MLTFLPILNSLNDLFETEVVTNDGNTINRWIGNAGGWVGIKGNFIFNADNIV